MQAVADSIDAGSTNPTGFLIIGTTGMATTLASFPITLGSTAATGALSLDGFPQGVLAAADGTAAEAKIVDRDDVDIVTGLTVGTSGTNITLDSVSITTGQTVNLTSATITHGA